MKFSTSLALATAALSLAVSAPALAKTPYAGTGITATATSSIDINLAGWQTFGGFGRDNNTEAFIDIGAGTTVTGFEYIGLDFSTSGGSYLSEFTLSLNNATGDTFMDWRPSTLAASGRFTGGGSWGGSSGQPGDFGPGAGFVVADGILWVTVYESFDDPNGDTGLVLDATVAAGTLRVFLAPIPEPGTYGMMALGLLAVGAAVRKRRQPA
jgi:hypothetical protein